MMAVFRIDKTKGYTVMSNYHLRDKRLSLKAKGLLSQMLSLPEDWDYTLSGLSFINRESKDAIRSAINELEQCGYIERRQTTDERGKFSGNEYVIHEQPVTEEPSLDSPLSENPTTGNPSTEIPPSEIPTQLNIDIQNTEKQINDLSSTDSFFPSVNAAKNATDPVTDGTKERQWIREQIEYDRIVTPANQSQLDELVEITAEVALNRSKTIRLGRDSEYPADYVRQRFRQITADHIEKVLDGIRENTTRVWNTKAYLLSALFNSVSTLDNHYTMLVNHDFHSGG